LTRCASSQKTSFTNGHRACWCDKRALDDGYPVLRSWPISFYGGVKRVPYVSLLQSCRYLSCNSVLPVFAPSSTVKKLVVASGQTR
jgi:hypothetical protein